MLAAQWCRHVATIFDAARRTSFGTANGYVLRPHKVLCGTQRSQHFQRVNLLFDIYIYV